MPDDLAFRPAVELARLVAARELSPVELLDSCLERIERLDGQLNSVVTLDADRARATARAAEARAGGEDAPPYLGVPILIKDLHLTEGLRTTFGTASLARFVPPFDEEHIARIRRAGFVVVGKTNVPELGTLPVTESALHGPARNPWDTDRTPGGSSGGAAAAMTAALTPVVHGSDGAGSIRIPASNCGVFGLKPARGRVTTAPLFGDAGAALSAVGPIARHVEDAAALLDVMRGPVPGDAHWAPDPGRPYADEAVTDPPPLRIGVTTSVPWATYDADALAALDVAITLFERLGHVVEPLTLPLSDQLRVDFQALWAAGLAASPVDHATLEPFNAGLARIGAAVSGTRVLQAMAGLQLQARAVVGASLPFDAVCHPTLTRAPLKVGELEGLPIEAALDLLAGYVALAPLANVTGQPSMSLPLHWTADGLPVGVTVTGRPADEATLFRLAGQVQRATDWYRRRPPVS